MEVVASLSQGRSAAVQCGLFTHKSVPVIFEPPCILTISHSSLPTRYKLLTCAKIKKKDFYGPNIKHLPSVIPLLKLQVFL